MTKGYDGIVSLPAGRRVERELFAFPATVLAPRLIGHLLCRATPQGILRLRIVETECYFGEEDTACHAHRGRTPRTETLYREGGIAYVYLCYGMHHLLNVVSGPAEHPEAVLLRGVEGFIGPGRLTRALQITKELNGLDLRDSEELWLEEDDQTASFAARIVTAPRVGIDYADPADRDRPWRYCIQ